MRLLTLMLAALGLSIILPAEGRTPSNAVLLTKVKTLTLRAGRQTSARRTAPIPQLKCVGGNARAHAGVMDAMRCTNVGNDYDGDDVQWTCTANLPSEFKLGSTEVLCEGYDSPDDPYVLKGSCGVEYRLQFTELGEQKYGSSSQGGWVDKIVVGVFFMSTTMCFPYRTIAPADVSSVWIGILGLIIYRCCTGGLQQQQPRRPPFGGGGWGGGPGGTPCHMVLRYCSH